MDGTAAISRLLDFAGWEPREARAGADRTAQYRCLGCESVYEVQYHVCPECGGFSVERCPSADERAGSKSQCATDAAE